MCLGAIYWARIDRVYYGATRFDAAAAGFDDSRFYDELSRPASERSLPLVQMLARGSVRAVRGMATKSHPDSVLKPSIDLNHLPQSFKREEFGVRAGLVSGHHTLFPPARTLEP